MVKVITYGTYDLLHYGHVRLLERAKALGDYLIVGVTADDFDKVRGKINVQQTLMERVEAVRATGIADEIIIEEYEGQKIDDIKRYGVDIFTVGSDWTGKFDYLNEYCKVVYLERTQGISSSEIRTEKREIRLGLIGDAAFLNKVYLESKYINGLTVDAVLCESSNLLCDELKEKSVRDLDTFIELSDAAYVRSKPDKHISQINKLLESEIHVLCESPVSYSKDDTQILFNKAEKRNLVLMEGIKTAYTTAYSRLLLLLKSGIIGDVVSVDSTCTSLDKSTTDWNGINEWGPTAILPILMILGLDYDDKKISIFKKLDGTFFGKIDFYYKNTVGTAKFGDAIKAEGVLVVSGTNGYVYVPAPWWKTDYFEIRRENPNDNKRYFYQLEGEGIRLELLTFIKLIMNKKYNVSITKDVSNEMSNIISECLNQRCISI